MPTFKRAHWWALALTGLALAGCASEAGENIFTGSLANSQPPPAQEAKIDPACVTLVSRIEILRREGISDKIEKAAAKRYKMTHADLTKADQLTKANAEFQLRCSTVAPTTAQMSPTTQPAATPVQPRTVAKKGPATKTQ